jgi:hypothetical protein
MSHGLRPAQVFEVFKLDPRGRTAVHHCDHSDTVTINHNIEKVTINTEKKKRKERIKERRRMRRYIVSPRCLTVRLSLTDVVMLYLTYGVH